jgi:hypothetical protein
MILRFEILNIKSILKQPNKFLFAIINSHQLNTKCLTFSIRLSDLLGCPTI